MRRIRRARRAGADLRHDAPCGEFGTSPAPWKGRHAAQERYQIRRLDDSA